MQVGKEKFIIAIDLGGTNLRVATVSFGGRIMQRVSIPTRAMDGVDAVIKRMTDKVIEMVGADKIRQAAALAVGAPGPTDPWAGVIISPPNLPQWVRVPLKQILEDRLQIKTFLGNDANVAALGEHRFGAGKGTMHMIYMTVSTGIGGGIIVDGKLLLGKNGGAGEIGHMTIDKDGPLCACGNIGCLEAIASGTAIATQTIRCLRSGERSSIRDEVGGDLSRVTAQVVVEEAMKGDQLAMEIMHGAATAIGIGVVNLVNLFDPEKVIIGGGVSNAGPLLFDPVRRIVKDRAMDIAWQGLEIVPTALGDDVGLVGAAALALAELRA